MATGTVDFFNDTGGYGFIDTEDSEEDVFFHMEDVGGRTSKRDRTSSSTSCRRTRVRVPRT